MSSAKDSDDGQRLGIPSGAAKRSTASALQRPRNSTESSDAEDSYIADETDIEEDMEISSRAGTGTSINIINSVGINKEINSNGINDKKKNSTGGLESIGARNTMATVSQAELQTLFAYTKQFKPETVDLDPILFPFLPEYLPAVGDLDAMIKIPPPVAPATTSPANDTSSFLLDLGLVVIDEPAPKQSDQAVLFYQLKSQLKATSAPGAAASEESSQVHKIMPGEPTNRLDEWIASTKAPEWSAQRANQFVARNSFPCADKLMEAWENGFAEKTATEDIEAALIPDLDVSLDQYVQIVCALLQIPLYKFSADSRKTTKAPPLSENAMIESLYSIFELYSGFAENQHFANDQNPSSPL